jgi:uncharacterized membrane protein YfcA
MAHAATLVILGTAAPDSGGLLLVACALPALGLGAWLGWSIYGRLDERRFRMMLSVLLLLSGLALVI